MFLKYIILILIALSISGCIFFDESGREPASNNYPAQTLNISRDLNGFYERGWRNLYERNEFDCSRMTTFMWDYIRTKYRVAPEIVISSEREHAWLALKVVDVGDTDRYLQWDIKGVRYYYIETTWPNVVEYRENYSMGNTVYTSTRDFYTTRIFMADDPVDANTIAGRWFNEFRLTKPDLDKLDAFPDW